MYNTLRKRGCIIPRPWAEQVEAIDAAPKAGEAASMVAAVQAADVLLLYVVHEDYAYRGLTLEVGIAIASGKRIVLCTTESDDSPTMENVALWHPSIVRVASIGEAIAAALAPPPPPFHLLRLLSPKASS